MKKRHKKAPVSGSLLGLLRQRFEKCLAIWEIQEVVDSPHQEVVKEISRESLTRLIYLGPRHPLPSLQYLFADPSGQQSLHPQACVTLSTRASSQMLHEKMVFPALPLYLPDLSLCSYLPAQLSPAHHSFFLHLHSPADALLAKHVLGQ